MNKELQKAIDSIIDTDIEKETLIIVRWDQDTGDFTFGMIGVAIEETDRDMIVTEIDSNIQKINTGRNEEEQLLN